ncbi:MAG: hypothetical protein C0393_06835 [Anaerolinea sp.]|nr:hypothetical protein [Anaerolinea sp.]
MGLAYAALGDARRAIEFYEQVLAIFEAIESPHAEWARDKLKEWGT